MTSNTVIYLKIHKTNFHNLVDNQNIHRAQPLEPYHVEKQFWKLLHDRQIDVKQLTLPTNGNNDNKQLPDSPPKDI